MDIDPKQYIDYDDFWPMVSNYQNDSVLVKAIRRLHTIQIEEMILHLAKEYNRLEFENEDLMRLVKGTIVLNGGIVD